MARYPGRNKRAPQRGAQRWSRRRWRQYEPARTFRNLPPEMRESSRGSVFGGADTKLLADALPQLFIHGGGGGLPTPSHKRIPPCPYFLIPLYYHLVGAEGSTQNVGGPTAVSIPPTTG